jgi:dCTP deaminase
MICDGHITTNSSIKEHQIQPASLDLSLGDRVWAISSSFLPGKNADILSEVREFAPYEIALAQGATLHPNQVYLAEINESLSLPNYISATCNTKSSIGRLDVLTRIVTDYGMTFDKIPEGYKGKLYVEISVGSFPIVVRKGSILTQIRFETTQQQENYVNIRLPHDIMFPIYISLKSDAHRSDRAIAYQSKKTKQSVDVTPNTKHDIDPYWHTYIDVGHKYFKMDPNEFYLFRSSNSISIPPDWCAELISSDPSIGEFRVHYAGFFDPGFGYSESNEYDAKAVLEVRCRDLPFSVRDNQLIAYLHYMPMFSIPDKQYGPFLCSHYQWQGLRLSKYFA